MTSFLLKPYLVLFRQETFFKVCVPATSEARAIAYVERALARDLEIGAVAYDGETEVVSAEELPGRGAP